MITVNNYKYSRFKFYMLTLNLYFYLLMLIKQSINFLLVISSHFNVRWSLTLIMVMSFFTLFIKIRAVIGNVPYTRHVNGMRPTTHSAPAMTCVPTATSQFAGVMAKHTATCAHCIKQPVKVGVKYTLYFTINAVIVCIIIVAYNFLHFEYIMIQTSS